MYGWDTKRNLQMRLLRLHSNQQTFETSLFFVNPNVRTDLSFQVVTDAFLYKQSLCGSKQLIHTTIKYSN